MRKLGNSIGCGSQSCMAQVRFSSPTAAPGPNSRWKGPRLASMFGPHFWLVVTIWQTKWGTRRETKWERKFLRQSQGQSVRYGREQSLQQSEKQVGNKEAKWETGKRQKGKQSGSANYVMQGSAALIILTTSFGPDTTAEFPLTHMTFPCSCKLFKVVTSLFVCVILGMSMTRRILHSSLVIWAL